MNCQSRGDKHYSFHLQPLTAWVRIPHWTIQGELYYSLKGNHKKKNNAQKTHQQTYGYRIPHLEAPKQEQSPRTSALLSLRHHLQFHSLLQPTSKELDRHIHYETEVSWRKEYGVMDHQLNSCMGKLQDIQASSNLSICSQQWRL